MFLSCDDVSGHEIRYLGALNRLGFEEIWLKHLWIWVAWTSATMLCFGVHNDFEIGFVVGFEEEKDGDLIFKVKVGEDFDRMRGISRVRV